MSESSEPTFRYLDGAMPLLQATAVRSRMSDTEIVLEICADDPTGAATFVVLQRIVTQPMTLIPLANQIDQRYAFPPSEGQQGGQPDP